MNWRAFISFVGFIILLLISIISGSGCANIVPPEGGPRDSLPPMLMKATPKDSSKNFEGNRINLAFDEYIEVDNFFQNVIISPLQKSTPSETHRLNTISIRMRDSLEPNTTYSINFGNSIRDLNEGNIMKNFTYVFSTGSYIDSFTLSGNVLLAETGKTDSTLIVMLHRKGEDSVLYKEKPRYITRLDGKGSFTFHNLPSDTFYLYALKDETRSYLYRNNKSLFAFADSPVIVGLNNRTVTLYAYEASKEAQPASTTAASTASNNTRQADKRLKFQTTVRSGNVHDLLQPFSFVFEKKLKLFDSAKIQFSSDTSYTPLAGYSWTVDSSKKKITLNYPWKENTQYHLILAKDFATDTLNQQLLRADTISFTTMKGSDYGKLSIRFRNIDFSKNPVLQFVQNGQVANSFPLTSETFSQELFLPGQYDLRILNDTNRNGKWDPGEFYGKRMQPETVKPVERQLNVKANYPNEVEIAL